MQIHEQINTLSSASIRKNPSFDRRIAVPQMNYDLMSSEIYGHALVYMSHGIEIDAVSETVGLLVHQTIAHHFQIVIHEIVVIKIESRIKTQGDQSDTGNHHQSQQHLQHGESLFS